MKPALWPILSGFSLWALAFIGLYALQYLGCYLGWDPAQHRLALIAGYIFAILLLLGDLAIRLRLMRQGHGSATALERIGLGTSIAALLATAITFAPALFVSVCL
jgi:NO-binding membrane sensor protein with MHYT domain